MRNKPKDTDQGGHKVFATILLVMLLAVASLTVLDYRTENLAAADPTVGEKVTYGGAEYEVTDTTSGVYSVSLTGVDISITTATFVIPASFTADPDDSGVDYTFNVTSIDVGAFSSNTNITSIAIPSSIATIEDDTFDGSAIEVITIASTATFAVSDITIVYYTGVPSATATLSSDTVTLTLVPDEGRTVASLTVGTTSGGNDLTAGGSGNTWTLDASANSVFYVAVAYVPTYDISFTLTGFETIETITVTSGDDATFTLVPSVGYALPDAITITMGTTLTVDVDYTYNTTSGVVVINDVTANVSVAATGKTIPTYDITLPATDNGNSFEYRIGMSGDFAPVSGSTITASEGSTVQIRAVLAAGYEFAWDSSLSANVSNGILTLTNLNDDEDLSSLGTFSLSTYSITFNGENVTSNITATETDVETGLSFTLTATSGYSLPKTITITMGGTTLVAGTDYTYNTSTGAVSLTKVTGNIVINAVGLIDYTITPGTVTNGTIYVTVDDGAEEELTAPITVAVGSVVKFRIEIDPGYVLSYWTGVGGNNETATATVSGNLTVGARLIASADAITISPGAATNGTIQWSVDDGATWNDFTSPLKLLADDTILVRAVADDDFEFDSWDEGISGTDNPYTIEASEDLVIGAAFKGSSDGIDLVLIVGVLLLAVIVVAILYLFLRKRKAV